MSSGPVRKAAPTDPSLGKRTAGRGSCGPSTAPAGLLQHLSVPVPKPPLQPMPMPQVCLPMPSSLPWSVCSSGSCPQVPPFLVDTSHLASTRSSSQGSELSQEFSIEQGLCVPPHPTWPCCPSVLQASELSLCALLCTPTLKNTPTQHVPGSHWGIVTSTQCRGARGTAGLMGTAATSSHSWGLSWGALDIRWPPTPAGLSPGVPRRWGNTQYKWQGEFNHLKTGGQILEEGLLSATER